MEAPIKVGKEEDWDVRVVLAAIAKLVKGVVSPIAPLRTTKLPFVSRLRANAPLIDFSKVILPLLTILLLPLNKTGCTKSILLERVILPPIAVVPPPDSKRLPLKSRLALGLRLKVPELAIAKLPEEVVTLLLMVIFPPVRLAERAVIAPLRLISFADKSKLPVRETDGKAIVLLAKINLTLVADAGNVFNPAPLAVFSSSKLPTLRLELVPLGRKLIPPLKLLLLKFANKISGLD